MTSRAQDNTRAGSEPCSAAAAPCPSPAPEFCTAVESMSLYDCAAVVSISLIWVWSLALGSLPVVLPCGKTRHMFSVKMVLTRSASFLQPSAASHGDVRWAMMMTSAWNETLGVSLPTQSSGHWSESRSSSHATALKTLRLEAAWLAVKEPDGVLAHSACGLPLMSSIASWILGLILWSRAIGSPPIMAAAMAVSSGSLSSIAAARERLFLLEEEETKAKSICCGAVSSARCHGKARGPCLRSVGGGGGQGFHFAPQARTGCERGPPATMVGGPRRRRFFF